MLRILHHFSSILVSIFGSSYSGWDYTRLGVHIIYRSIFIHPLTSLFQRYVKGVIFFVCADVSHIGLSKSSVEKQSEKGLNVCSLISNADPISVHSKLFFIFIFIFVCLQCALYTTWYIVSFKLANRFYSFVYKENADASILFSVTLFFEFSINYYFRRVWQKNMRLLSKTSIIKKECCYVIYL